MKKSAASGQLINFLPNMINSWRNAFVISAIGALLGGCGEGSSNQQTLEPVLQTNDQLLDNMEADFLLDSYSYGLMIVHYSELAAQQAQTPTVKNFAESSLSYHRKLNKEVADLAAARQVKLPDTPGEDVQAYKKELAGLSPREFERRYLQVLGDVQAKMISRYEAAEKGGLDAHLHDWSLQTLPQLRAHAQAVSELSKQLD